MELTKWELTKWELTKWDVDQMGIDKVGITQVMQLFCWKFTYCTVLLSKQPTSYIVVA